MNKLLLLIFFLKGLDVSDSVVGGRKTKANKYPWLAYLEILGHDGKESQCGGTIISSRHILTAAHCLMDKCGRNVRKVSVHFGAHDICEEDWTSTHVVRPSRYIFHPGYNPKTEDNDIAILKLKRDVNFGPKVWIISLPPDEATKDCQENEFDTDFITIAREDCDDEVNPSDNDYTYEYEEEYYEDGEEYENFEPGEFFQQAVDKFEEFQSGDIEYDYEYSDNCTTYYDGWWASIAGWGATYKFDGSCILRHARKKIYPNHHELCLDEDYVMDRDKICAYNPKWSSDTCQVIYEKSDTQWSQISSYQGDSGSGLIVVSDTGPVLVGVVSYGWDCGDNRSPGVYSRVQFFKSWIMKIIMESLP